jgi:hypothetical protein
MRWLDAASSRKASERLLAKLGLAPQPPPPQRCDTIAQMKLLFMR